MLPISLNSHVIEVMVTGPGENENRFSVHTVRTNPASTGVVTGKQTYSSFLSSVLGEIMTFLWFFVETHMFILGAKGQGSGVHLC